MVNFLKNLCKKDAGIDHDRVVNDSAANRYSIYSSDFMITVNKVLVAETQRQDALLQSEVLFK